MIFLRIIDITIKSHEHLTLERHCMGVDTTLKRRPDNVYYHLMLNVFKLVLTNNLIFYNFLLN